MLLAATAIGSDIANYIEALVEVYIVLILLYLVSSMALAAGVRFPVNRAVDWLLGFLRDVCEPYLRIFRKLIPSTGMIDLSPMLAIISLLVVEWLATSLIRG